MDIFKRKILAKLIIILIAVLFAISLPSLFYLNKKSADALRANLDETILNLREVSRLSYAIPMWQMGKTEITYLNRALLTNRNIVAVNIYDESWKFKEGMQKDLGTMNVIEGEISTPFAIPEGSRDIRKVFYTVFHREYIVGSFEIFYTERYVNEEISRRSAYLVFSFYLIGLAMIAVIFILVRKMLIAPVLTLADISRQIARNKDYPAKIERRSGDEIGILYESIADMLREIKRNEDELERTRGYLSNIIESMPSMLISIDREGTVNQWNHAAEAATGIPAAEILGRNIWEKTDFFDGFKESVREIMETLKPVHLHSHRFERETTSFKDVSLYPLTEHGAGGVVIRMDDVTELEKKENLLRQAQKMETIGTLASGIAHDFNNILGGIIGNVSLIEYKLKSGISMSAEELSGTLGTIGKAGNRAADMVKQLLTLSSGKEVSFSPIDLNLVIKNVLHICRNTFDKVVALDAECTDKAAMMLGDYLQIEQTVLNLCINACHAMTIMREKGEDQGGTIRISLKKTSPDRDFLSRHPGAGEGPYWLLCVEDNGIGIPEGTLAKIFDPFFTTKGAGRGTGLGLAIVYNIIRQHSGFIDVTSSVNAGTTFSCYLPCLEDAGMERKAGKEGGAVRGEGLILVVDDEALMRDVAVSILAELGYETLIAGGGDEALEIFRERKNEIDMVLLDIIMPKKSGRHVCREMKKIDPGVRVLFASGYWQDGEEEDADGLEDTHFIQKPYTIQTLSEAINKRLA